MPLKRSKDEYKKSEASRRQIIDAAVQTLAKKGYAKTSVSDIAREAGMSKGVVHYQFQSKDDLISHVVAHCYRVMSERVRVAWCAEGSAADRIRRALREMWKCRADGSPEMRVMTDLIALGIHDPNLKKDIHARMQENRELLVAELTQSFAAYGLKPKFPAEIIPRLMIGTMDGLAIQQLFDPLSEKEADDLLQAFEILAFSFFEI